MMIHEQAVSRANNCKLWENKTPPPLGKKENVEDSSSLPLPPSFLPSPAILPSLTLESFQWLLCRSPIHKPRVYLLWQGGFWMESWDDDVGLGPFQPSSLHLAHLRPLLRQHWRNLGFQRAQWENHWSVTKKLELKGYNDTFKVLYSENGNHEFIFTTGFLSIYVKNFPSISNRWHLNFGVTLPLPILLMAVNSILAGTFFCVKISSTPLSLPAVSPFVFIWVTPICLFRISLVIS